LAAARLGSVWNGARKLQISIQKHTKPLQFLDLSPIGHEHLLLRDAQIKSLATARA
jgi:hypothetical protein